MPTISRPSLLVTSAATGIGTTYAKPSPDIRSFVLQPA
jgi:hypothetical protein